MKLLLTIAACMVATLCLAQTEYSFKESYPITAPATLGISSSDGNIEVSPGAGNSIEVFYIVRKGPKLLKISRAELEKELTLTVNKTSSSLSIEVKYPDNSFSFGMTDRVNVSFRVVVPARTTADLRTSDGNIALKGLAGDQKCRTSDGDIKITTVEGNVLAKTSDGNIDAREITGTVEVKTSDGNIALDNVAGNATAGTSDGDINLNKLKGDVDVSTSDGNISFREISGSFSGSTSDGNVKGTMLALTKKLSVRTSDGNIDISIPDKLGLDLDIRGESLNIPLTNFSGTSDEKLIRGKSNGGGIAVNLSSNGHVTLHYQ